jgi:transposase
MAAVMIGIDPHKGSHTAVAINAGEVPLGRVRVPACLDQAGQLLAWALAWPERTWAVEGATGLGHLLAQQLVAAGERVLDIQPKLAARIRVLEAGNTSKNDPNDARSVAVAALRSRACREVTADGHAAVLRMRSRRHQDLGQSRNQVACRLHAVLCDLVPGGLPKEITAAEAARIIEQAAPAGAVGKPATTSPPSCSPTCAAWTPRWPSRRRSSPQWSGHRAPRSPACSASARWSRPSSSATPAP